MLEYDKHEKQVISEYSESDYIEYHPNDDIVMKTILDLIKQRDDINLKIKAEENKIKRKNLSDIKKELFLDKNEHN